MKSRALGSGFLLFAAERVGRATHRNLALAEDLQRRVDMTFRPCGCAKIEQRGLTAARFRPMLFKVIALAIIGAFAYSFQGFDGDYAVLLAALPVVVAVTFILLGPG